MKDQDINIAIAKACGIKVEKITYNGGTASAWVADGVCPIPDYCKDLNAMHEAEKVLKTNCQMQRYLDNLRTVCRCVIHGEGTITATAHQRAEAFLRTMGKWKD